MPTPVRYERSAAHPVTGYLEAFETAVTLFFDEEPDLLVVLNENGEIVRINPAFKRALGYEHDPEVLRQMLLKWVWEYDLAAFVHSFDRLDDPHPPVFRLLHKDHGLVTVQLVKFRFRSTPRGWRSYLIMRRVAHGQTTESAGIETG